MKKFLVSGAMGALLCLSSLPVYAQTVNFADANLEQAVRDAFDDLGTPLGAVIDASDLVGAGFVALEAIGLGITNLSGLEFALDLEFLDLSNNSITDVSPLGDLTNLTYLDLGSGDPSESEEIPDQDFNFITDITPLSPLTSLEYLNLAGNRSLTNIGTLSSFTSLTFLALAHNPISDFSALSSLTNLERLGLVNCGVTDADLANISGLTGLLTLFAPGNSLTTLAPLAGITGIQDVIVSFNDISNIDAIENFTDPEFLLLNGNQIVDLTPMVNNTNIGGGDIVNIGDNPLSNEAACDQIPVIEARFTTGIFAYAVECFETVTLTINITGTGTTNLGAGEIEFDEGETAAIVAVPIEGSGFAFDRFQGDASGTEMFVNVVMDEDKTVEVVFVTPGDHELTIVQDGPGSGTFTPAPGTYSYLDGRIALVVATPDPGSQFAGWTGDATSPTTSVGVLMDDDKTVTGTFVIEGDTFDLTINQVGEGTVDPEPGTLTLPEGAPVRLTAIPALGWEFDGWTGDVSGADPNEQIIDITMTADRDITANFVPDGLDHTLFIEIEGEGRTTPSAPTARFLDDTLVELIARTNPDSGFAFDRWEGDVESSQQFDEILMDDDKNITAVFVSPGDHNLTINNVGGSSLSLFPEAGVHAYLDGRTATVAAFPQPGEFFGGFTGAVTSVARVVTFDMDEDKEITATFGDSGFDLTINVSGEGTTTPEAGQTYALAEGTAATLYATPTVAGWEFLEWQGDIGAADPNEEVIVVTIDQDRSVTAVFVEDGFDWSLDINIIGEGSTDPEPGNSRWFNNDEVLLNPVGLPGSGFAFDRWEGAVSSTNEFVTLLMDSDKEVDAVFVPGDFDVTINVATVGTAEGTTFPLPGVQSYLNNRVATLTAVPEPGSFFAGWTGDIQGLNAQNPVISFNVTADRNLTANFTDSGFTLNLAIQGQGATQPSPGAIALAQNEEITLNAFDSVPGWRFDRWEGDIGGGDPNVRNLTVTMTSDRNITAVFEEITFDAVLTIQVDGPGQTDPAPGQIGFVGTTSSQFVSAIPDSGAVFIGWQGDIGTNNPQATGINLLMDQDRTITAVFAVPDFDLTVERLGSGQVLLDGESVSLPQTFGYASGTQATLEASNITGFQFDRWLGDIGDNEPTDQSITVTMDQDRTITAVFLATTRLTLSIEGTGETDPEPGVYTFRSDEQATLTALPIQGSAFGFVAWEGDIGDADPQAETIVLNMDQDRTVTAVFAEQVTLNISVANEGTTNPEPGSYQVVLGEEFTVQAVSLPGSSFIFDRWEGDIGDADPESSSLTVLMDGNRSVTAVFAEGAIELFSHSADQDGNGVISLSELLRVIAFFNTGGFHCAVAPVVTEDGYVAGTNPDAQDCEPHSSDYNPQNWQISLSELLRLIQFFNVGGYYACPDQGTEDGFCQGAPPESKAF